jgi:hypothetical protein
MARGQQKLQSQQKNAKRLQDAKKAQGHDQRSDLLMSPHKVMTIKTFKNL